VDAAPGVAGRGGFGGGRFSAWVQLFDGSRDDSDAAHSAGVDQSSTGAERSVDAGVGVGVVGGGRGDRVGICRVKL
jgi:hypothetical protein